MLYSQNSMASPQTPSNAARKPSANSVAGSGFVYLPLIAGWLVPGAGHFLLGKWGRGALLTASVLGMFVTGLALHGMLFSNVHDILDLLGLVGDLGNGLLFLVGRVVGLGADQVQITSQDWGTRFIEVAGLLNVIAAVDAHNIRTGRKAA
jgi:TM2 domain-containing membrane protein YozV